MVINEYEQTILSTRNSLNHKTNLVMLKVELCFDGLLYKEGALTVDCRRTKNQWNNEALDDVV